MENTREYLEEQEPPRRGMGRDLQRLYKDGAASADELRQFLGQMRGRSPQDVMGIVASSSLVRSIALATVGCGVLLAIGTVIPYLWPGSSVSAASPSTATETAKTPAAQSSADTEDNDSAATDGTTPPSGSDLEKAANAMGIGEAADPKAKPDEIGNKLDKLLEGID